MKTLWFWSDAFLALWFVAVSAMRLWEHSLAMAGLDFLVAGLLVRCQLYEVRERLAEDLR